MASFDPGNLTERSGGYPARRRRPLLDFSLPRRFTETGLEPAVPPPAPEQFAPPPAFTAQPPPELPVTGVQGATFAPQTLPTAMRRQQAAQMAMREQAERERLALERPTQTPIRRMMEPVPRPSRPKVIGW